MTRAMYALAVKIQFEKGVQSNPRTPPGYGPELALELESYHLASKQKAKFMRECPKHSDVPQKGVSQLGNKK